MDAVRFVEERRRMFAVTGENPKYSLFNMGTPAEEVVREVEEWATAHPRKTRQDEFLEQWPNAQVEFGVLQICPRSVMGPNGWRKDGCGGVQCVTCRREFWSQEVE